MITVKSDNIPVSPGQKPRQANAAYDPAMVYVLEFCTVLALRDVQTVELLSKRVVGALQAVLRDASRYHPIIVERTTFYLFSLLQASYVSTRHLMKLKAKWSLTASRILTTSESRSSYIPSPAFRRTSW